MNGPSCSSVRNGPHQTASIGDEEMPPKGTCVLLARGQN